MDNASHSDCKTLIYPGVWDFFVFHVFCVFVFPKTSQRKSNYHLLKHSKVNLPCFISSLTTHLNRHPHSHVYEPWLHAASGKNRIGWWESHRKFEPPQVPAPQHKQETQTHTIRLTACHVKKRSSYLQACQLINRTGKPGL